LPRSTTTIADGLRGPVMGLPFSIIQKHVESIFTVTEGEIAQAMRIVFERLKLVIEPSAAVAVAVALFHPDFKRLLKEIKTVGIVLEGGNVDTSSYELMMPWVHLTGGF